MGFTQRQILWRVELPLALPAIMAGIRIATVTTSASPRSPRTSASAGSAQPIFNAIQSGFKTQFVAAGSRRLLALVADGLLVLLQRGLAPWERARRA